MFGFGRKKSGSSRPAKRAVFRAGLKARKRQIRHANTKLGCPRQMKKYRKAGQGRHPNFK